MRFLAVVDHENNATDWWESAREHADSCPEWARDFIRDLGASRVSTNSSHEFAQFIEWCRDIPGWYSDASHARHPLVLSASLLAEDEFRFATDSESGTIRAQDFHAACQMLQERVPEKAIADGAWGWVENYDLSRFELGECP